MLGKTHPEIQLPRRRGNLFSLIDIAMLATGKSVDYAAQQIRTIRDKFQVSDKIGNLEFQGHGQRSTPVGDIYVVVKLIMLPPGGRASRVRKEAASFFVRAHGSGSYKRSSQRFSKKC